jgi:hypothetical protein
MEEAGTPAPLRRELLTAAPERVPGLLPLALQGERCAA